MDATQRPLKIPPEFANYAEKHGIFDLYKRMLCELIINKPDNPFDFMIEYLSKEDDDLPHIVVLGPPQSGKRSISSMLCRTLGTVLITPDGILSDPEAQETIKEYTSQDAPIPTDVWADLVKSRLSQPDVSSKGWVMVGIPEDRTQQHALAEIGIFPKHCVILEAPDSVLIDRYDGKHLDPDTGDVYHSTFDWPTDPKLAARLVPMPLKTPAQSIETIVEYHRSMEGVRSKFERICRVINADQPKSDVFAQVMTFVCQPTRSMAPHTPRIILLGPTGSGKGTLAQSLADRYGIVNVSCGGLILEAIAANTNIGLSCKNYVESGNMVPDAIVLEILRSRLCQLDCSAQGWVVHGYPRSREQAKQLQDAGYMPNRVFVLDISYPSIVNRLMFRAVDPITGDNYHLLYNPPRLRGVKERLKSNPKDKDVEIRTRMTVYNANIEEIKKFYSEVLLYVNADQEAKNVFDTVETMIVNPIPKCKAPDKA